MKHTTTFSLLLLILITLSCLVNRTMAQTELPCGTERIDSLAAVSQPYYGNNQFVANLADSIENSGCNSCRTPVGGIATEAYVIPVKIWIYRTDAGAGGITNERAETLVNLMNQSLRTTGVRIRLYISGEITRVNNTNFFENIECRSGCGNRSSNQLFDNNRDANALNIHIIRTNRDNFGGRARFPWQSNRYSFAVVTDFANNAGPVGNDQMVNTMVHELGHTLGLTHTHESARWSIASNNGSAGNCFQESVSRTRIQGLACLGTAIFKKCEINGDMLCDTDADPELRNNNVNANGCVYIGGGTDKWGDAWVPPTTNFMSYSAWTCREVFTRMQRGVMYHYATFFGSGEISIPNPTTFYRNEYVDVYENDNFWPNASPILPSENQYRALHGRSLPGGDNDWVRFTVSNTDNYTIETGELYGSPTPDTWLDLFIVNADGTVGATPIASDDDSGDGYFSRIFRSLTPGNYAVRVRGYSASVNGPYYLKVVPQSYVDPAPGLSVNISGPTYVGECQQTTWTATASGGAGGYSYRWFIDATNQQVATGNTYVDYPHYYASNDEYYIRVEATSGSQTASNRLRIFSAGCGGGSLYSIYPNPADSQVEVAALSPSTEAAAAAQGGDVSEPIAENTVDVRKQFDIVIYDKYSQPLGAGKSKNGRIKLEVKHLPDGLYFMHIKDPKNVVKKRLMVRRQ